VLRQHAPGVLILLDLPDGPEAAGAFKAKFEAADP